MSKKKEEKKKKVKIGIWVVVGAVALAIGGMLGAKLYLERTTETVETVKAAEEMRSFSGYFKEYLADRVAVENLINYQFREMSQDEILAELTELKDGFGKVSRGMNNFEESEAYGEIAEIAKADANEYLTLIRGLRAAETGEYGDEADRQVAFIEAAKKGQEGVRSKLYVAREAYTDDPGKLTGESIVMFGGVALVETGGGVMNIFVGDTEKNITVVTEGDFESGTVKTIGAEKLYGYTSARAVEIGKGVKAELAESRVTTIEVELGTEEATTTRTKIGLFGKTVWGLKEEIGEFGEALVAKNEKGMSQILSETEAAIRGK